MNQINKIYINGEFVTPKGTETFDLISPVTNQKTGEVVLGNAEDTRMAIAAAKKAFTTFSKTTKEERINFLKKLHESVSKRENELVSVMVNEYGGTLQFCRMSVQNAISAFTATINTLESYDFEKPWDILKYALNHWASLGSSLHGTPATASSVTNWQPPLPQDVQRSSNPAK